MYIRKITCSFIKLDLDSACYRKVSIIISDNEIMTQTKRKKMQKKLKTK